MGWLLVIVAILFGRRILSGVVSLVTLAVVLAALYLVASSTMDLGALDATRLLDVFRERLLDGQDVLVPHPRT